MREDQSTNDRRRHRAATESGSHFCHRVTNLGQRGLYPRAGSNAVREVWHAGPILRVEDNNAGPAHKQMIQIPACRKVSVMQDVPAVHRE
jgi:hypothetical protein